MNKIIEAQLNKVKEADLSQFDPETNTYKIPRKKDIKVEEDGCYLIRCKPTLFTNIVLKTNWNNDKPFPKTTYLKIDVSRKMSGMIKVVGIGYDIVNHTSLDYFWTGWLTLNDIEVIKKL